jgi:hypothetical protein
MNDRAELLEKLSAGRDQFLASLDGVTEEQAAARPVAGWSILECAEHVAVVEEHLRRTLMEHGAPTGSEMSRDREGFLSAVAANRGRKIQAPEVALPHGRFNTLAEAVECFCRNREQTIAYIASCREDLRRLTMDHPMIGAVSGQETLILMTAHPFRHAQQVRELRSQQSPER